MLRMITISSAVVAGLLGGAGAAIAQGAPQPPAEPVLRIDPGMHTALIQRIAVDRACRVMATGSYDKTVRIWDISVANGAKGQPPAAVPAVPRLLRTLRPPIGPGHEGKVFAVAMAPDGQWVAAGGWDVAATAGETMSVYIFDTASGRLLRRTDKFAGIVNHLTVSMDGRYLAAMLGDGQGIRVWETATWQQVGEDKNYDGIQSYGAAFDAAGRLFTTTLDGTLRRYGPDFKLQAKVKTTGGQQPFSIAVHPDGAMIAIGYNDTTVVEVFDSATLQRRFAVDTAGVQNGNLSGVAWSGDKRRLFAGGRYNNNSRYPVRMWGEGGRAKGQEFNVAQNTIGFLLPCGENIAFSSADPAFGLISADGKRVLLQDSVTVDMRAAAQEDFTVAPDGRSVRFGSKVFNKEPLLFDLTTERLTEAPEPAVGLLPSETQSLKIEGWRNLLAPTVDGKAVPLERYETSRALAIAPGAARFVLGTEWYLRAFNRDGTPAWNAPPQAPGVAWGVNIVRDKPLVVAAYGDGTIRWHRLEDGAELLALFVHAKDRRWVAWTPKGYYLASPGAEDLIGWHVNQGWEKEAQFFPADRFRGQFNRPDIVKLALELMDEDKAIDEANARGNIKRAVENVRTLLPPVVRILSPVEGTTFSAAQVTLEYSAVAPNGRRVTDVDIRINAAGIKTRNAAVPINAQSGEAVKITLPVPPSNVVITLVARDGDRTSEPVSVTLRWDGALQAQPQLPKLRALLVGVSDYRVPTVDKLGFAHKDAVDLDHFLKSQEGRAYSKVETTLLSNADREAVLQGLDWLEQGSEEGDVSLLFLAGHGITDQAFNFYFLPADGDPMRLRATAIHKDEILRAIRNRRGSMVVLLDACHAGAGLDTTAGNVASRVDMNRLANEIGDKTNGVFLYAAAMGRQLSEEHRNWGTRGNGAFTAAIIEGLSGKADSDGDGIVESDELAVYVRRRVMAMTEKRQEPVAMKPQAVGEITLAGKRL